MRNFLIKTLILSVAIYIVGRYTTLIYVNGWFAALIGAFCLAIMNAVVKPILTILTLPITCLTFGIFMFFINGLTLMLSAWFVPNFQTNGWFSATIASLIITVINAILSFLIIDKER